MELSTNQPVKSKFAQVLFNPDTQQNGLFATVPIKANAVICHFSAAETVDYPNRYTVQTGEGRHIILDPLYLEYINHSCEPNCFFDTTNNVLLSLRAIQKGEEFRFFYPSTEWMMEEPFECQCKTNKCLGMIKGAHAMSEAEIDQYRFSDFIVSKLRKEIPHVFEI